MEGLCLGILDKACTRWIVTTRTQRCHVINLLVFRFPGQVSTGTDCSLTLPLVISGFLWLCENIKAVVHIQVVFSILYSEITFVVKHSGEGRD